MSRVEVARKHFASEALYRELFERATDAMVLLDLEGNLVELNPAAARMLGLQREELVGRPLLSFIVPEEMDATAARFAGKIDGSAPASSYRSVLMGKDGRRVPVDVSSEVMLRDGEPY